MAIYIYTCDSDGITLSDCREGFSDTYNRVCKYVPGFFLIWCGDQRVSKEKKRK